MNKKVKSNNLIGILLVVVILLVYLISQLIAPQVKESRQRRAVLRSEVDLAQVKLNEINAAKDKIPEMKSVIDKVNIAVPAGRDYASVLVSLENLASKNQLSLGEVRPEVSIIEDETTNDQSNYGVTLNGSYPQIQAFVNDLENNLRLMKVTSLSISNSDSGLMATVSFSTYSRDNREE